MVLLKTAEHNLPGYEPVATCGEWLVALMNDSPQYAAGEIRTMQKHTLTDEVFVLLSGRRQAGGHSSGDDEAGNYLYSFEKCLAHA